MEFKHQSLFEHGHETTPWESIGKGGISVLNLDGREFLSVDPAVLRALAKRAFSDIQFFLRPAHLEQVAAILDDPEASDNDRFVAASMLQNAAISARGELPFCQDTGTAIVMGWKGEGVLTGADDEAALSRGIYDIYQEANLRYSQNAALDMFREVNTGTNLPAQIDLYTKPGAAYEFLFMAKGGGSANKTYLYQQTRSLLTPATLSKFLFEKLFDLGTSACPPYHLTVVIGGTSAEANLKTVKLASAKFYDDLPTTGNALGRAFRDLEWEAKIFELAQQTKIGAQFGGKYFALDVRVIRLPRHGASCPVGLGVSCSADRQVRARITREGAFIEALERRPERYLEKANAVRLEKPIEIDLDHGIDQVVAELSKYPVKTRVLLSGTLIVARDIAHARLKELLDSGKPLPDYFSKHPIYYAGPAKTPAGMATGSFGPTTAGRMDAYIEPFMALGASRVTLAKGNRSKVVAESCKKYKGFYLGSIGGPAALLAHANIKSMELVDFEDLGMEAIRRIRVEKFPAFIICDDKGNDFFAEIRG
ncbi:MAG: fumarate hydratase [Spirochaetes bacterium]|nr:fumarate hydratase [Spirochaetota bacterium]